MIRIFDELNEIQSEKRLKLLSIPLKSSGTRTSEVALARFNTYWQLVCHLKSHLPEVVELVIDPFLVSCFGPFSENLLPTYFGIRPTKEVFYARDFDTCHLNTVIALICLLGKPTETVRELAEANQIPVLGSYQDFGNALKNIMNLLISSVTEASVLITYSKGNEVALTSNLWFNFLTQVKSFSTFEHFELILKAVKCLITLNEKSPQYKLMPLIVVILIQITESKIYPFKEVNYFFQYDCVLQGIKQITSIILNETFVCPDEQLTQIVKNLYTNLKGFRQRHLVIDIVHYVTISCDEYQSERQVKVKAKIWKEISSSVIDRVNELHLPGSKENAKENDDCTMMVVLYLNWPLKNIIHSDYVSILT